MDRRSEPEAADGHNEDSLQKALGLIVRSYNNISPEELYKEAILCFDSLIDISHNTESVRDFALKHDTDLKYLVDGANFVISRMHFNPENNCYITLGISRRASLDEIRERWKRLMLLYHPDRLPEGEDLVSERAKKVNEAYNTLKDISRRMAYDKKLRELDLQSTPVYNQSSQSHSIKDPSGSQRHTGRKRGWVRIPAGLPKFLVLLYIVVALIAIGFIYFQDGSSNLESELSSKTQAYLPSLPSAASRPRQKDELKSDSPASSYYSPGNNPFKKSGELKIYTGQKPIPDHSESYQQFMQKENKGEIINSANNEKTGLPAPAPSAPAYAAVVAPDLKDGTKTADRVGKDEPVKKQVDLSAPAQNEHKAMKQPDPGNKTLRDDGAILASVRRKEDITRDDVEDFIRRYSASYEKGDLAAFMPLFSRSAVDNRNIGFEAIRNSYAITFSEKIKYYRLDDPEIKIDGQYAFVTGRYDIMRYVSSENRVARYKGKIRWKLVRENNFLKIMRAEYDN